MCLPQIASIAFSAYSQYQQGVAQSRMYDYQAAAAKQEGEAALKRGETRAGLVQDAAKDQGKQQARSAAQLSASQKAALAANGIDLSSVTAQDITLDTSNKVAMDEMAIRHNADLESWSVKNEGIYSNWQKQTEATQHSLASKNAKKAGKREAFGTILGGAAQISTMASSFLK